jgi:hypothetical protein
MAPASSEKQNGNCIFRTEQFSIAENRHERIALTSGTTVISGKLTSNPIPRIFLLAPASPF